MTLGISPVSCPYCGNKRLEKRKKAVYSEGKRKVTLKLKKQHLWYCPVCKKRCCSLK